MTRSTRILLLSIWIATAALTGATAALGQSWLRIAGVALGGSLAALNWWAFSKLVERIFRQRLSQKNSTSTGSVFFAIQKGLLVLIAVALMAGLPFVDTLGLAIGYGAIVLGPLVTLIAIPDLLAKDVKNPFEDGRSLAEFDPEAWQTPILDSEEGSGPEKMEKELQESVVLTSQSTKVRLNGPQDVGS